MTIETTQKPSDNGNADAGKDKNNSANAGGEGENKGTVNPGANSSKPADLYKDDKKTIGLDKFLELKNNSKKEIKELRGKIDELSNMIKEGATKSEADAEINALAQEFDLKPEFLKKLSTVLKKGTSNNEKPKSDEGNDDDSDEEDKADKGSKQTRDSIFEEHFPKVLENMPEFEGVVNKEVIKQLSFLPGNANKTFQQIIEETYGSSLTGKRTIDATKPGGGKEPGPLDFTRARKDQKYFLEVMNDPKLKAEYNNRMLKDGF